MKELSIEEKARRYDEALTIARNIVNSINVGLIGKNSFEAVFPELKESDDERIRESITEFFKNYSKNGTWKAIPDVTKWIAWLEKQAEQKSDWSEEDERMFFSVIWHLRNSVNNGDQSDPAGKLEPWIRMLKDRVQPHPKQKWSKKDEEYFNSIAHGLSVLLVDPSFDKIKLEHTTWFKSLKDRVQYQSYWKPSDEQMRVLDLAIRCGINRGTTEETILVSLFNDLKKLMDG